MTTLREAAEALLNRYVELVNSGDCGFWDPEKEEEVKSLRAALVERKAEPLEHVEKVSTEAAMSQWERSLKRPDLCEKDRVRGAIEAYKRQAFAFRIERDALRGAIEPFAKLYAEIPEDNFWPSEEYRNLKVAAEAYALSASPSPVDSRDGALSQIVATSVKGLEDQRLLPKEPTGATLEVMASNLADEFGVDFVLANKEFALAVYAEAWATGTKPLSPSGNREMAKSLYEAFQYKTKHGSRADDAFIAIVSSALAAKEGK